VSNRHTTDLVAQRLEGVLIGTAVGDALGLPAENLPPSRIQRLWKGEWRMRFFFGKGMISDDTEHTIMVAQTLLAESENPQVFQKLLASKLCWWFAALPAGVGLATARSCIKLWLGFPANKAAVPSAGSGPAMRSAIIGAYFADDPVRRKEFVLASSRLTHRSWQAETAALAVAECAAYAATHTERHTSVLFDLIAGLSQETEWQRAVGELQRAQSEKLAVHEFATRLGLSKGVTGYSLNVALVAMYSWNVHWTDFRAALVSVLDCGGDTDTAGAIVGAIAGASAKTSGIPKAWTSNLMEWPRSTKVMKAIAQRLSEQQRSGKTVGPVRYFWPALPFRNAFFLLVVLFHGLKRLLPPY
jgi:ADP-ribosyl-[dinitrogen reductase] hydrolase